MDDRKLTLIVVPHGDLETRSYEISYPRLRAAFIAALVVALIFIAMVASWFPVAAQAGRARSLERDLARLEGERATVAELARTLEQVEAQYERVRELLGADAPVLDHPPLLPPLRPDTATREDENENESEAARGVIDAWPLGTRGFVTRTLSEAGLRHPGLDIAVPENSYIRAAGPGTVIRAGMDDVYGRYALIDHGGGLQTLYGHAARIHVRAGDQVQSHEIIGLTGSSGQSTGPHLHFEVRRHGQPVDPLLFVRQP